MAGRSGHPDYLCRKSGKPKSPACRKLRDKGGATAGQMVLELLEKAAREIGERDPSTAVVLRVARSTILAQDDKTFGSA